jgi:hypothetical protein
MKNKILFVCLLTLLSSCGVITKARYGNGLKINLETRLFSKKKNEDQTKKTALKTRSIPNPINKKKDSFIFVAEEFNIDEPKTNTLHNISESPVIVKPQIEKTKDKTSLKSKIRDLKKEISVKKLLNPIVKKQIKNDGYRPLEPHAKWAGILFYGSILLSNLIYSPIWGVLSIVGIILAFIAVKKIKLSNFEFSGYGIAFSIVIITYIMLILSILALLLLILIITRY